MRPDVEEIEDSVPSNSETKDVEATSDISSPDINRLSTEHRQYLLDRHGTLDLCPIPEMNDADPYNWPQWKV